MGVRATPPGPGVNADAARQSPVSDKAMARPPVPRRNRQFALAALLYLTFLYGTLGLTPRVAGWALAALGRHGYSLAIDAFILAVALFFLALARRRLYPLELWRAVGFALIGAGFWLIVLWAESPGSRLHALQYGVLALLVTESLRGLLPLPRVYAYALVFVLAAGLGDEALQALLPNRNAMMKEVVQNWASATLAQAALLVLKDSRSEAREPLTDPS